REKGEWRRDERRHRNQRSRTNEIERRQQSKSQGAQTPDQDVILPDGSGQHHPDDVRRQYGLAAGPARQAAHPEQEEENVFGFQLRDPPTAATPPTQKKRKRIYLVSSSETRPPYFSKNHGVTNGSAAKTTMLAPM